MANCTTNATPSYEVDFAEFLPGTEGVDTIRNAIGVWTSDSADFSNLQNVNVGGGFNRSLPCVRAGLVIYDTDFQGGWGDHIHVHLCSECANVSTYPPVSR
jgi:hypothetical protein